MSPTTQTDKRVEQRPTTTREKAVVIFGKLVRRDREPLVSPDFSTDRLTKTPKTIHVTRTKRVDWDRWAHAEGSWYVAEETTTDMDTARVTEELTMYRVTLQPTKWGGPNGYNERPQVEEKHGLLVVIDDLSILADLQAKIDAALVWESQQLQPGE
ncbi:MAG TPA: hypothetical protein VMB52_03560 [Verrucomicrobiae bacterium]|nr:hypothetical protein [Verrucomicrobiae bacterium]